MGWGEGRGGEGDRTALSIAAKGGEGRSEMGHLSPSSSSSSSGQHQKKDPTNFFVSVCKEFWENIEVDFSAPNLSWF